MSGYDYNVGYLPGAVPPSSRIKQIIKWPVMALVIYFAVQMIQKTLDADQRGSQPFAKQSIVVGSATVASLENVNDANVDLAEIKETENVNKISESASLSVTTTQDEILQGRTNLNTIAENTMSNNHLTKPVETSKEEVEVFDEELAQLINKVFSK